MFGPISGLADVINALLETSGVRAVDGATWDCPLKAPIVESKQMMQKKDGRSFTSPKLAVLRYREKYQFYSRKAFAADALASVSHFAQIPKGQRQLVNFQYIFALS